MEKKKKQLILIACLIPVLGFAIFNSLNTLSKKKKRAPKTTSSDTAQQVEVSAPAIPAAGLKAAAGELPPLNEKLARMQKAIADEEWGRDPFRRPPLREEDKIATNWKDFKLTGVIPGHTATINGEIIGVGEEFEGYTLIRVDNYRITLEKAEESYILTMPED